MTTSQNNGSYLAQANKEFRLGNYSQSISLYKKAIQQNPDLAESLRANILIAEARLDRNTPFQTEKNKNDIAAAIRDIQASTEKAYQASSIELTTQPTVKKDESYVSPHGDVSKLSLNDILSTRLTTPAQRLIKEYDSELESQFIKKVYEIKDKLAAKQKKVFVSIIMPTYNRAPTIQKAVDSVIAQTHSNWELIIVDDGSTDNTIEVLENYAKDARIKVIDGEHKGVSAARNKGLDKAAGDYIYYLDSDNSWSSHYLELMTLTFLHTKKLTGYAAIILQDEHDNVLGYRGEPFDWDQCLESNFIDINIFAHHRSLLKSEGPYDTSLRRMVDWDLILRYTKTAKPFYAPFIGCFYLESRNDASRITLSEPLAFQKVVRLKNSLNDCSPLKLAQSLALKFAIKIPAPFEERQQWGDYHYADSLRIALEEMGHSVAMDFHGAWYTRPPSADDVVLVIRGLTAYTPRKGAINIIWNISHPDQVPVEEFERYDIAYVASASYANLLSLYAKTKVFPLIQCSDPQRFYYQEPVAQQSQAMLFVGNSRNEYRPIVRKAIESGKDIAIYGTRWSKLVDNKYIYGENIPNTELCSQYASYGMVLNDHWESMREYGYVSNRVFDVLASGGTLVSDPVPSISRLFGDAVVQLKNDAGFESVGQQLKDIEEAGDHQKVVISEFVNTHHSFTNRARVICDDVLARLGLPTIWSHDLRLDAGDCSFESTWQARHTVGLILEKEGDEAFPNYAAYRRLISPLTTDEAYTQTEIIVLQGIDDPLLPTCNSIVIQGLALENTDDAAQLLNITVRHNIGLYADIYQSHALYPNAFLTEAKIEALLLVMHNAAHVWFSTNRLALSYCYAYKKHAVIVDTIDARFWRNFRKPQPKAALSPKYRILCLASSNDRQGLEIVFSALEILFNERGAQFELIIIGDLDNVPNKPWIKVIKPNARRSIYPIYANWLINSERFDIGIVPALEKDQDTISSDYNFLHYTALGLPTLSSRIVSFSALIDKGLVVASDNTVQQWKASFSLAMDNRELMLDMADRAWAYTWQHRSSARAAESMVSTIQSSTTKPKADLALPKAHYKKVAVCLHLYYVEQWPTIKVYLDNITDDFDLFITCTSDHRATVENDVFADFPQATVMSADNHGMDVLPFLVVNHEHALWRYSAVLKLHTKNTKTPDDKVFGQICLESLLGSKESVNQMIRAVVENTNVGVVGPDVLYRSAESLMYVNAPGVSDIFEAIGFHYPKTDWGFFAGTMFWIRGSLLHSLAMNFEKVNRLALLDSRAAKSGGDGTWAHAMERVFGALPGFQNMYNSASYMMAPDKAEWGVRLLLAGEFSKSLSFRVSSKWHVLRYNNIEKWSTLCLESSFFDNDYYIQHSGGVIPEHMSPIAHYILHGDDLNLNPSAGFSTAFYKLKNRDVVHARIPTLIHYLVHGVREGRLICAVSDY